MVVCGRVAAVLLCLVACFASQEVKSRAPVDQDQVDYLAQALDVKWTVVTNVRNVSRYNATMTLTNTGSRTVAYGQWAVYFYSVFPLEPDRLTRGQWLQLTDQGLRVKLVNGMLYTLGPTASFRPLGPGYSRVLRFHMGLWSVSWSDSFPNWYVTGSESTEPRIIVSTAGDDPAFVSPPYKLQQQKRYDYDLYPARTAQVRYHRNYVPYAPPDAEVRVVPKPWQMNFLDGSDVTLSSAWQVFDVSPGSVLGNEVSFLVDKLADYSVSNGTGAAPTSNAILLNTGNIILSDDSVNDDTDEAHSIQVDDVHNVINVTGRGASGVFLGLQTLLSLLRQNGSLPKVTVYDAPRFRFRGLFLDLSRNFRPREDVERLLRVMAMYKLNKLHLHLADDEGWRLEIPGLPELTQVGSKRCHDLNETECLIPQLGSGPFSNTSGSGYLTVDDYRSILATAQRLHIEVIPEIDMPGHSRAAIKAMELRYRTYTAQNDPTEAQRYRLVDPDDESVYASPQNFNDNAINVCMESAYAFVTKVVQEVKKLHEPVQPLHEFHSGYDEVGPGAWVNSTVCQQLLQNDPFANLSLKQYFFTRVANITHAEGLALGGWEDGLMLKGNQPFNRSLAPNTEVYANIWDNVWEWGTSSRTYTMANMGYLVVMSHATNLYFDHPYEPHWEERGYYWATRFTDTLRTFGFMPMNYYANIDKDIAGRPISRESVCGQDDVNCPALVEPQNIVGMQGHLWSETVRTLDQVDYQLFPRVLALAERAWHSAPWESEANATLRHQLKMDDWYSFARAVGHRELPRLDRLGIAYRIPPPGAMVERQRLRVATGYPGLAVEVSMDYGKNWRAADGTERFMDTDRVWLRSRSTGGRYSRTVELLPVPPPPATSQALLDYMSQHLAVQFEVVDNYLQYGIDKYVVAITLNNTGDQPIPAGNWELLFPSVQWPEEEALGESRAFILPEHKMAVSHVQGYLFRLAPLWDFPALESGAAREITFRAAYWSVSKYEQFPNYTVVAEGANAKVVSSTAGESLSFVKDFSKVNQWKRDSTDRFDPLTPSARFGKQADVNDYGLAAQPYLPTPRNFDMDPSKSVSFRTGWVIVAPSGWTNLTDFLKDQFTDTELPVQQTAPTSRYIELRMSSEGVPRSNFPGAYNITVSPDQETVVIVARDTTGALYGIQSLVNMALQSTDGTTVAQMSAADAPRFQFRGMFLDVSRNFQSKESVLKLLQLMGIYKLNRLQLHLADDEGWRLEIPGLPELTAMGSQRCYDPTEERCLTPVMGSGADPHNAGSGFYSIQDYTDILTFARRRHIEVIPEFDMPGHARAAIKAMALRRRMKREAGDLQGAHEYELDEEGDPSLYWSVQLYNDDAVNPCMESSYRFIHHVMKEVKKMHEGVNPLRTYHFGGDEVAKGAWVRSKACSQFIQNGTDPKFLFSTRVAAIAAEEGLNLGAWEDGLMDSGEPIPRDDMRPREVFANAWQNVWEWGLAARAYVLANEGYKVIMSQATHLYFDHPYEPDPDERGFYWATRYTDTRKAFHFQPQHLWNNVDITRFGDPYTLSDVCGKDNKGCPDLRLKDNIVGMQGHLWSETVRTADQLDYMIFPRLLALAERAWHVSEWEGQEGGASDAKLLDWSNFANTLGYGQLSVLDRLNVSYRICPPGVRQEGRQLKTNTEFPGLKTQYVTSDNDLWQDVTNDRIKVTKGQVVHVRTLSADGRRSSKPVRVQVADYEVPGSGPSDMAASVRPCVSALCVSLLLAWLTHVLR